MILVCALTGDQTCNLDVWVWPSIQLSYLARVSVRSIWSKMCFKTNVSLLISIIAESGVLKSPTIIALFSISPFRSVSIFLMLGVYLFVIVVFLMNWPPYYLYNDLCLLLNFRLKTISFYASISTLLSFGFHFHKILINLLLLVTYLAVHFL